MERLWQPHPIGSNSDEYLLLSVAASVSIGALQYTIAASRRHELGVRRAVGARRLDLVIEGMFEAGTMALVGALGGAFLVFCQSPGLSPQ